MSDWLKILKDYVDTLETLIGGIDGATTDTLHGKLGTDTELADYSIYDLLGGNAFKTHSLSTMLGAFTATNNLKGVLGAYTTAANLKAAIDGIATVTAAIPNGGALTDLLTTLGNITAAGPTNTQLNTAIALCAQVADGWDAALATILDNFNATRIGDLDELADANLPTDVANVKGVVDDILADTEVLTLAAIEAEAVDALESFDLDHLINVALGAALDTFVIDDSILGFILAKADVSNFNRTTDSLEALQEAIAAITTGGPTNTQLNTAIALCAQIADGWDAALATILDNFNATRIGDLDELAAANLPADIDELITSKGAMLFTMDFWSLPQEEVAVTIGAGDKALPSVTVADLPGDATIVRAIAMFKFRMVENHTYAGENKLDGAQEIQVAGSVDAINFVDTQFTIAETTREGGDVVMGLIDIATTVSANGAYAFHWDLAKAIQTGINFNDIQMGIRIWYSI